jgi:Domain of unknown function (DUF4287)/Domain of unknown function (DUF5655)
MTYQAYLDTIRANTGKGPEDFIALAREKGLLDPGLKAGAILVWLKEDFGLGHGHAMAIYGVLKRQVQPRPKKLDRIAKHFGGAKANWRGTFDQLHAVVAAFGDDVQIAPTDSYLSFVRAERKFGIVQIRGTHMDIGIKRPGAAPTARFEPAGNWNTMVTHRVRIARPFVAVDAQLLEWLMAAYEAAASPDGRKR